ncbi:MAG TPA: cytochrome c [Bryobacteraceae bacterium]|nr:cytochrome c [Bryobacteraceae bacterium]
MSWVGIALLLVLGGVSLGTAQDEGKKLSVVEARKLKNPVPYSKKSIARGRSLYVGYACTGCHGADGKSTVDVVANATDLTAPSGYKSGTSDGEMYRSIRDGQGSSMPSFESQVHSQEDIWQLVNFIHSLWPESQRPPLQEDK